jgi:integrase
MGVPVVGKQHHGKANTSQSAAGKFGTISKRISRLRSGGRATLNHQQSLNTQEPTKNNPEHALGALSSGGTPSQSYIHPRRLSDLYQQLDPSAMGEVPLRRDKNYRSGALAASDRSDGRNQSQAKVRHVRRVLTRRTLGVLWPQSDLFRHSSWGGGKARSKHWCASQCEASEIALVLSPEEVKLGLSQLEFRDQLLVFVEGALGIRQGELGALRWVDCDFDNMNFSIQHSYYWRRGGHLKNTKTEASAKLLPMHASLKHALMEWRSQSLYNQPTDFVFPSERLKGSKPLDLASVLKKKIQPAFKKIGIKGVGWHTFRHTVGTMLAEMGEHQLMIRDYLRHANLHVTNKYLQATTTSKRLAQGKLVDAILPGGVLSASKSTLVH